MFVKIDLSFIVVEKNNEKKRKLLMTPKIKLQFRKNPQNGDNSIVIFWETNFLKEFKKAFVF